MYVDCLVLVGLSLDAIYSWKKAEQVAYQVDFNCTIQSIYLLFILHV